MSEAMRALQEVACNYRNMGPEGDAWAALEHLCHLIDLAALASPRHPPASTPVAPEDDVEVARRTGRKLNQWVRDRIDEAAANLASPAPEGGVDREGLREKIARILVRWEADGCSNGVGAVDAILAALPSVGAQAGWRRYGDEKPVVDRNYGERWLLTWNVRAGAYDLGCIDGEWSHGEVLDGHADDLWLWLHQNPAWNPAAPPRPASDRSKRGA